MLCPGSGEVFALTLLRTELAFVITPAKEPEQPPVRSPLMLVLYIALLLVCLFVVSAPGVCFARLDHMEHDRRQQYLLPSHGEPYSAGISIPEMHFFDSFLVYERKILIRLPLCGGKCCGRKRRQGSVEAIVPETNSDVTKVRGITPANLG